MSQGSGQEVQGSVSTRSGGGTEASGGRGFEVVWPMLWWGMGEWLRDNGSWSNSPSTGVVEREEKADPRDLSQLLMAELRKGFYRYYWGVRGPGQVLPGSEIVLRFSVQEVSKHRGCGAAGSGLLKARLAHVMSQTGLASVLGHSLPWGKLP